MLYVEWFFLHMQGLFASLAAEKQHKNSYFVYLWLLLRYI